MFNKKLYNTQYHYKDLSNYTFLVTGGAGFIGSNLVEYLLKYNARHVRVLDNLSNGYYDNIKEFTKLPNFEFIASLRDSKGVLNDMITVKLNKVFAFILATGLSALFTFIGQKYWLFKSKNTSTLDALK